MPRHPQQSEEQATPGGTTRAGGTAGQEARPGSSARHTQQMPTTRRPLPEQRANLGKQYPAESQPRALPPHAHLRNAQASRSRNPIDPYAQQERPIERTIQTEYQQYQEMDSLPTTRPPYTRQRPPVDAAPASYPARTRPKQDGQRTHPMQALPPANNYYHTDDHGPALPADVYDEQDMIEEEEDDAARAMLYGDYLDDDEYEEMVDDDEEMDEVRVYQREDFTRLPAPHRAGESRSYPQMTREIEALPAPGMHQRPTRDLRMPTNAQPSSQIQARTQEVKRYNRTTQPLNPQVVADMQRERELPPVTQQVPQPARVARQMMVREQPRVPTRLTPIPPSAVAPVAARAVCPRCRGAGYLRLDVPFGHPNFGKPIACECKEAERKEKRRQQLREMSNLDAHHSQTFRTFNPRVPGVQEAAQVAAEYAQNPEGWLLLIGPNGCGKTHLAAAIANQSLDNGSVVLFSVVPDLLDHLRAAFAPNATEVYDQLFAKMREAEVLVLDDLGAQQSSPWANEKLFQLLNYRYNLGMPTVITANPRGLQGIDERIRSRLTDVSLIMSVNLERARDYRPNHPRRRD
jgi:DNA replication protein DnaC